MVCMRNYKWGRRGGGKVGESGDESMKRGGGGKAVGTRRTVRKTKCNFPFALSPPPAPNPRPRSPTAAVDGMISQSPSEGGGGWGGVRAAKNTEREREEKRKGKYYDHTHPRAPPRGFPTTASHSRSSPPQRSVRSTYVRRARSSFPRRRRRGSSRRPPHSRDANRNCRTRSRRIAISSRVRRIV